MWPLRRSQPPPPPPPPPESSLATHDLALILAIGLIVVFAPIVFLVYKRYETWISSAIRDAFKRVDADNSGTVDCEELFSCTLAIYLELNMYGIYVVPPDRGEVEAIFQKMDQEGDDDGALDYDEFARAMKDLTAGALWRCITTIVLTFLCPGLADHIVYFTAKALTASGVHSALFPSWLQQTAALIPHWVPTTTLSTLLLMLRPLAQDYVANGRLSRLVGRMMRPVRGKIKLT